MEQGHPGSTAVDTDCAGVQTTASKTGIDVWGCSNACSAQAVVWGEMGEHDRLQGSDDWHAEKNSKHVELRLDLTKLTSLFSTSVSADALQLSLSPSPYFLSDLMGNIIPRQAPMAVTHFIEDSLRLDETLCRDLRRFSC
jgi:hypothetical protein